MYNIQNLVCGRYYFVKVTAINTAGEGPHISEGIWLG
jgi:hypothetical protein